MKFKIFMVFIVLLFIINMVFAEGLTAVNDRNSVIADINKLIPSTSNIKVYDIVTKTATIKDITGATEYAKIKLLTPLNNFVGLGYQKVAEFEIDGKTSYTDFLKTMYFFDTKNKNAEIKRGFDLKKEVITQIEEPIYELICVKIDDKNKDNCLDFIQKDTGKTNLVNVISYDLLTEKNFGVEKQIVSIWVQIDKPEIVEWIPELYGTIINEWANWTADLNTGLISYWKLDETTGDRIDSKGSNNLTPYGTTYYSAGKILNALDNNQANSGLGKTSFTNIGYSGSVSLWYYNTGDSGVLFVFNQNSNDSGNYFSLIADSTGAIVPYGPSNRADSSLGIIPEDVWTHIVITSDATKWFLYVNGVYQAWASTSGSHPHLWSQDISGVNQITIGSLRRGSQFYDSLIGKIDEVGLWDRNLSQADVSALYNSGNGLPFNFSTLQNKIDWNVYQAGTSTHLTAVAMDCNVNALDLTNKISPFTSTTDANTSVSCIFSKAGYDSNTIVTSFDANKTFVVYLSVSPVSSYCGTGGTEYDINGYRIHRFDSNSTFVVVRDCNVEVLVVAGGGGGGGGEGGGGAGGLVYNSAFSVTAGNKIVTIGAGGLVNGGNGKNSVFDSITAIGGGGGGSGANSGKNGGAGGGAGYGGGSGGVGSQGKDGGSNPSGSYGGAGGGGAGGVGANSNSTTGGAGGNGLQYDINGTLIYYAGGGGGVGRSPANGGAGGLGGGGAGRSSSDGIAGTPNTGGGGGAGGGSGIVIIRYLLVVDECSRTLNQDWVVSSEIDCNAKAINLGTGKLILSTGARLRLYDSNLSCSRFDINASGSQLWLGSKSWIKTG